MCGITGFCDFTKKTDKQTLVAMTDVLSHRGPDDSGYSYYQTDIATIGLGHRRLSIIDLSSLGHQPMAYFDYEIVFNGEIYNYKEIKKELEFYGYTFNSHSDTEVILASFHKWGVECVHRFIGMFAFALYDKKQQVLYLFRDRIGVKPLYYYFKNDLFLFASELKSFHTHPNFKKEINKDALALFFQFGYILQPFTIFQNCWKLEAGFYAILDLKNKSFRKEPYWSVIDCYNQPKLNISFNDAIKETERILRSAFEYRMVADVPVGMFLSGGYDSTVVTTLLQKDRTERIKTFTIGFYEEKYNEAHHAKRVAEYLGTDHTEYYCTQKEAQDILPLIPDIWDEPFGDSSAIPTTLVSKLARQKVTVTLSADGGDEIFGGYDKYVQATKYFNVFNKLPFKRIIAETMNVIKPSWLYPLNKTYNFENRYNKIKSMIRTDSVYDTMIIISRYFNIQEVQKLLNYSYCNQTTGYDEVYKLNSYNDEIDKMMCIDFFTYQLDDILVKVDRATMSVSLEGREPLLDHRIIEFISRLPSEYKIKNGNKKYLLKELVHQYLPKEIMDRPKMGFSIPMIEWFDDELKKYVDEYLTEEKLKKVAFLNTEEIQELKKTWLKNNRIGISKIWLLLVFMMWWEKWME
ncbi:asparagine synthase (glutamine-hydrolyzing) [Treponema sp. J25]|uniref:asparagine synthase (glutamine-hydrolyzing) n=1 Tax=Treponema sp. J25 TaxID=2094121 RepID=UPI001045F085|nr:asparagine synthase (glutamine-hydrolyzing) [Treponema sp. J25]TCW60162.1 asparagine synthase (glutamine-hydrolyzing) [Treponema sp. J25]